MKKNIYIITAILSLTLGGLSFYLLHQTYQLALPGYALHYQQARPINNFTLTDELGEPFSNTELLNKWSFMFFGYTSCPDVCPMTLQNLSFIYKDLKDISPKTQVVLVSVDPKRDSVEKLNQYINYFNPEFKALRAEHDILFPFARNLGLMYAITGNGNQEESGEESYWVDHSASLVLINPRGMIEAIFKPEQKKGQIPYISTELLLSDYQKIVALYE